MDYETASRDLKQAFPKQSSQIGKVEPQSSSPIIDYQVDGSLAENDFDFQYIPWETSIVDWGRQALFLPIE